MLITCNNSAICAYQLGNYEINTMITSDRSIEENTMNITYDDLVEKQKFVDRRYSQRVADLTEGAQKILEEYRESLVYHGENRAKIAFIGEVENGEAEFMKLSDAQLDHQQHLAFSIVTDLSHSDGRPHFIAVAITLSARDGKLLAQVGECGVPFIIPVDNSAYSYHQVCLAIKKTISDRLDSELSC